MPDLIVIGGGPGGSTAAMVAARRGIGTLLLEKEHHPRFRIGESLLPRQLGLLHELGLSERVKSLPRTRKLGASFAMGNDEKPTDFFFAPNIETGIAEAINVERALFDAMLADAARDSGVDYRTGVGVKAIEALEDGRVAVRTTAGESIEAKLLIDASGQQTVVGRHLRTRQTLPDLQKVAHYAHFAGVEWRTGEVAGSIVIVMCEEGWFWLIPLDGVRVSVGLVIGLDTVKRLGIPHQEILPWGIERCPIVARMMRNAQQVGRTHTTADYSYQCRPYAGPGYYLVGDAAVFVDPIFSTGVTLAMMSARLAGEHAREIIARGADPAPLARAYARYVEQSSSVFFRLVRAYYTQPFRELFLTGRGPFGVHKAIFSILAGHVFPRPAWGLRWRHAYFDLATRVQRRFALAPRRAAWSLAAAPVLEPQLVRA